MPPDQARLLERAIGYALGSVAGVAPRLLSRPTPCSDWDLRALLQHVNDSLAALYEAVVDRPLLASVVAGAGAIELAVHGWDISRACGQRRPIPPTLAADLLAICPLLVTEATRHPQFAARVAVSPMASTSDRLVAFLGRHPDR